MEEVRITVYEFMKKVVQKNFKPSTLNDRIGQCITCGANREVTYWREDEVLKKFIIVSCNH